MKTITILLFCFALLSGCSHPKQEVLQVEFTKKSDIITIRSNESMEYLFGKGRFTQTNFSGYLTNDIEKHHKLYQKKFSYDKQEINLEVEFWKLDQDMQLFMVEDMLKTKRYRAINAYELLVLAGQHPEIQNSVAVISPYNIIVKDQTCQIPFLDKLDKSQNFRRVIGTRDCNEKIPGNPKARIVVTKL